jgi:hypothetical protein
MDTLPNELIEQIILSTDKGSFKNICKSNKRFKNICDDISVRKLKQMGYRIPDTRLDYTSILHEFLNPNIIPSKKYDKPQYKIVPVLLSGCYENNLDFVKFFLFQDLSNVESVTGSKSPELLQKCLKIAIDKNYNKIVKFLNENNVIFRM